MVGQSKLVFRGISTWTYSRLCVEVTPTFQGENRYFVLSEGTETAKPLKQGGADSPAVV